MNDRQHVELQESPLLKHYANWRPRLKRGATFAGTAAFLSKTVGGDHKHPILSIGVPTLLAGGAGVADAALEEKLRERDGNLKAKKLVERGFDELHLKPKEGPMKTAADLPNREEPLFTDAVVGAADLETNILLTGLARQRTELAEKATQQLRDLFPSCGADGHHYGRGLRMTTGRGSISSLLGSTR